MSSNHRGLKTRRGRAGEQATQTLLHMFEFDQNELNFKSLPLFFLQFHQCQEEGATGRKGESGKSGQPPAAAAKPHSGDFMISMRITVFFSCFKLDNKETSEVQILVSGKNESGRLL